MTQIAPGAAPATTSLPPARLALLFMVMLVSAAGNTAMQSVMPSIGTRLHIADFWVSLAYTWSALLWMVMAPFWARRSDQRGRKAMMALGLMGFTASFVLCGLVLMGGLAGLFSGGMTLVLFAAGRSLYGGFGSAAPPAVQAYVASRTSRTERTQALSLVASSFGLGTVVGPALAPFLHLPGLGPGLALVGPFAAFSVAGLVVLVLVRLRLPDDLPAFAARGEVTSAPFGQAGDGGLSEPGDDGDETPECGPPPRLGWADRRMRPWLVAGVLGGHAQAVVLGIIGFLVLDRLHLRADPDAGAGPVGLVLMSGAFATLLAQWGLIPLLKLSARTATLGGIALAAAGTLLLAAGQDLHAIASGYALASVGFGLFRPGFTSGASLAVSRAEQGASAGIVAAVNGSAYIIAPAAGVWLYSHYPPLAWGLVEAFCLGVLLLGWRGLRERPGAA